MRLHFTYKNYPGAPELTERSRKIGTYTHWLFALVYGSLIGMALMMLVMNLDPMIGSVAMTVCFIGMPIYMSRVRKKKFAQLDEEYRKLAAEGKLKL